MPASKTWHMRWCPAAIARPNRSFTLDGVFTHPGDSRQTTTTAPVMAAAQMAPWGSTTGAVESIRRLGPQMVVPVHDFYLVKPGENGCAGLWLAFSEARVSMWPTSTGTEPHDLRPVPQPPEWARTQSGRRVCRQPSPDSIGVGVSERGRQASVCTDPSHVRTSGRSCAGHAPKTGDPGC